MGAWVGTLLSFGLGILFVVLGYPMFRHMVRPNTLYGFRTVQTVSDPEVWYPVNERSGKHLIVMGLVLIVVGTVALLLAHTERRQLIIIGVALVVSLEAPSIRQSSAIEWPRIWHRTQKQTVTESRCSI